MTPLFVAIYIVVTFLQFIIMKYMISDAIKKAKNKKAKGSSAHPKYYRDALSTLVEAQLARIPKQPEVLGGFTHPTRAARPTPSNRKISKKKTT